MRRPSSRTLRAALWAVLGLGAVAVVQAEDALPLGTSEVDLQWGVKIPVRDGVSLNATVYKPHGHKNALPVIFTFTPYIGDSYTDRAMFFAKHVRGRGNSGGEFEPFVNKARDGYDAGSMAADSWTCDPLSTEAGEGDAGDHAASLTSQRSAFNLFGEGVIYHSEGFPAATRSAVSQS